MHLHPLLHDLAAIFGVAVVVVLAVGRVGLPPIAGFLVAGILVGPGGLGLVGDLEQVETLAELGVALLLFTIGLEFSLERLRHIGRQVAFGGGLQVLLTIAGATILALAMGQGWKAGVFWGYLTALSSTAIVLRALAERAETAAPHGRFVVGVLIFQDLCIVPMMLTLPMLAGTGGSPSAIALTLAKAAAVVIGVLFLARRVVPRILHRAAAARGRDLFLLAVLVIAISVASATAQMGLSLALGAFLAGVVIADTDFVHQATSEVAPFRDALASLFFVSIGMLLDPAVILEQPLEVGGLLLLLLVGKFVLATLAGLLMGFPARIALIAGLGLAQVGEFSFVLLREGQAAGMMSAEQSRLFIAASVLTMIATPLLLTMSPRIGAAGAALLRPLERLLAAPEIAETEHKEPLQDHVIVAGLGLGGQILLSALENTGVPYVAVELNPATVVAERKRGRNVRYGDVASLEVLEHVAEAGRARMLVLLLSDADAARRAAALVRAQWPDLHVIVRAHRVARDESTLAEIGVEVVSEDYETALEIVERVLFHVGPPSSPLRAAVSAARYLRDEHGERKMDVVNVIGAMYMDAVTLASRDWAVGKTVAGTGLRASGGALIVALSRQDRVAAAPEADLTLSGGDALFLFGTREQIARSRKLLAAGPEG